jgi:hypothetical protein
MFSKPMTLTVSNETKRAGGNLMPLSSVEINLQTIDGLQIFTKVDERSQALAVTANPSFFAVYMKGNVIKIYDTRTGNLIVPYYLGSNVVFLSSNIDGNLCFLDMEGKLSLINVETKA